MSMPSLNCILYSIALHLLLLGPQQGWAWLPYNIPKLMPSASRKDIPFITTSTQLSATRQQESRRQWLQSIARVSSLVLLSPSTAVATSPGVVTSAASCDPSVTVWKRGNRLIYLQGTAHISQVSADLAGQLVRDVHPNAVFIELDIKRVGGIPIQRGKAVISDDRVTLTPEKEGSSSRVIMPILKGPALTLSNSYSDDTSDAGDIRSASTAAIAISPTIVPDDTTNTKQPGFIMNAATAAVGNAIRGMYRNLDQAGFRPGQEFATAVAEGQKIGADIILGDRDVEVTLRRLTQALAVTDMNQLLNPDSEIEQQMKELLPGGGAVSADPNKNPDAWKTELSTYVEAIKTRERVTSLMSKLKEVAPALVQVMLTERDTYMAAGLDTLNDEDVICAVMGIAHVDGVERNLRARGWRQVSLKCPKRT